MAKTLIAGMSIRYVLDRMRLSSIATRLKEFLETDWKNEAAMLLEQRRARGEGPVRLASFAIHALLLNFIFV